MNGVGRGGFRVWVKANGERFSGIFRITLWEWEGFQVGKGTQVLPLRDPSERGDSALVSLRLSPRPAPPRPLPFTPNQSFQPEHSIHPTTASFYLHVPVCGSLSVTQRPSPLHPSTVRDLSRTQIPLTLTLAFNPPETPIAEGYDSNILSEPV